MPSAFYKEIRCKGGQMPAPYLLVAHPFEGCGYFQLPHSSSSEPTFWPSPDPVLMVIVHS